MKNLKLQLMALGILTAHVNMFGFGWIQQNVVNPLTAPLPPSIRDGTRDFFAGKAMGPAANKLKEVLGPIADQVVAVEGGITQGIDGMQKVPGQINATLLQTRAIVRQIALGAQQVKQGWDSATPTVTGALQQIKSQPEAAPAITTLQQGASAIEKFAKVASSSLQSIKQGTAAVRDGLVYVERGTDPLREVGNGIKKGGAFVGSMAKAVDIEPLVRIGNSVATIGGDTARIGDIVQQLKASLFELLNLMDVTLNETTTIFTNAATGAHNMAVA